MRFFVHIYNHMPRSERLLERLLLAIQRLEEKIMTQFADIETAMAALDIATNAVAAKLQAEINEIASLRAQIAAGTPVTQAQLDILGSRLTGEVARLQALAADPANPVPA